MGWDREGVPRGRRVELAEYSWGLGCHGGPAGPPDVGLSLSLDISPVASAATVSRRGLRLVLDRLQVQPVFQMPIMI